MNNKDLVQKAISVGFDSNHVFRSLAEDGKEAVFVPRDIASLEELESLTPSLKAVDDTRFYHWGIRA